MKIDTDGITPGNRRINQPSELDLRTANNKNFNSDTTGIDQSRVILDKISSSRTLIDAMIISQMAKNIMNKAFQISSKLRDVAMDALNSGKIKGQDLKEALSDTRTSFNKMQESFVPVLTDSGSIDFTYIKEQTEVDIELPELKKAVIRLNDFEEDIKQGNNPDLKKIEKIIESINGRMSIYDNAIDKIALSMKVEGTDINDYTNLLNMTIEQITTGSEAALVSQGNLNRDAAIKLFQNESL